MALDLVIRDIRADEHAALGQLMVEVYADLDGFPKPTEQPGYYEKLTNIGRLSELKDAKVLVAIAPDLGLIGGVVYFGDISVYGSGGAATKENDASGIRLLGVSARGRGRGAGKALTEACIQLARDARHRQVILHTTQAMQTAWALYERLGFARSTDLDFMQGELPVFGFRLAL